MALFDVDYSDVDEEVRRDDVAARLRAARLNHYCSECRGFTGNGSPCEPDDEDEESDE